MTIANQTVKASSRPAWAEYQPGTPEWMKVWQMYPGRQDEMLAYQELLKLGINPVEGVEGFRVSNSALEATACSVKALLRYGYRVINPQQVFTLLVGTAVHKALAEYFRTGDPVRAYDKLIASYPEGQPPEERLNLDSVGTVMHHYLNETLKHFPYYVHPAMVEVWFEQMMYAGDDDDPEPIILVGQIDLLPEDPQSKAMMVLDHKTTGKISEWWLKKWRMSSSLNGYLWAAQRFMPQSLFPGTVVNAIELPRLPMPGRKCKTHGVDYGECRKFHPNYQVFQVGGEPWMIEEWKRSAIRTAKRLRTLIRDYGPQHGSYEGVKHVRMLGKFNGLCVFCPYLDFCLADRPIEWIGTVLPKREDLMGIEG